MSLLVNAERRPSQIWGWLQADFAEREREAFLRALPRLGQAPPPPAFSAKSSQEIYALCEREVRASERLLQGIGRSFFGSGQRMREIEACIALKSASLEAERQAQQDRYLIAQAAFVRQQNELDRRRQEFEARLMSLVDMRSSDYMKKVMEVSARSTNKEKILRAFERGLITWDSEPERRLAGPEAEELLQRVRRADGFKCAICSSAGGKVELHVHHIVPLSKLGTNQVENLVTLCYLCHSRQHKGFTVSRRAD